MSEYYTKTELDNLVADIVTGIDNNKLVIFVGAGISVAQGYPNWNEYVKRLIDYWQYKVTDYLPEGKSFTQQDIRNFDAIQKIDTSNKRKIDFLYTLLQKHMADKFLPNKLSFEKLLFDKIKPSNPVNVILREITALEAYFITTNYDLEIEHQLDLTRQPDDNRYMHDLNKFAKDPNQFNLNDVLHIHGSIKGQPEYFVSSSADYTRQYLKNPSDFNKLKEWFNKKKPIVLFIGSSLEEDEILSLIGESEKIML